MSRLYTFCLISVDASPCRIPLCACLLVGHVLPLALLSSPVLFDIQYTTTSTICTHSPRRFLLALRDALALAHALGRTLVLPAPHCFCDRFDPFRALTATNPLPPSTTSHSSLCTPHHWTRLRLTSVPPSSLLELHPPSAPTASATGRSRPLPAPLFFIFLPSVLPLFSSAAFLHPTSPVTD